VDKWEAVNDQEINLIAIIVTVCKFLKYERIFGINILLIIIDACRINNKMTVCREYNLGM
jgi:hypothetical protein